MLRQDIKESDMKRIYEIAKHHASEIEHASKLKNEATNSAAKEAAQVLEQNAWDEAKKQIQLIIDADIAINTKTFVIDEEGILIYCDAAEQLASENNWLAVKLLQEFGANDKSIMIGRGRAGNKEGIIEAYNKYGLDLSYALFGLALKSHYNLLNDFEDLVNSDKSSRAIAAGYMQSGKNDDRAKEICKKNPAAEEQVIFAGVLGGHEKKLAGFEMDLMSQQEYMRALAITGRVHLIDFTPDTMDTIIEYLAYGGHMQALQDLVRSYPEKYIFALEGFAHAGLSLLVNQFYEANQNPVRPNVDKANIAVARGYLRGEHMNHFVQWVLNKEIPVQGINKLIEDVYTANIDNLFNSHWKPCFRYSEAASLRRLSLVQHDELRFLFGEKMNIKIDDLEKIKTISYFRKKYCTTFEKASQAALQVQHLMQNRFSYSEALAYLDPEVKFWLVSMMRYEKILPLENHCIIISAATGIPMLKVPDFLKIALDYFCENAASIKQSVIQVKPIVPQIENSAAAQSVKSGFFKLFKKSTNPKPTVDEKHPKLKKNRSSSLD